MAQDIVKKDHQRIFGFLNMANSWLQRHPEESPFRYAVKKVFDRALKIQGDYQEATEEINIRHCSVDKDENVIRDEHKEYKFTKKNLEARNKERNELFKSEVEIQVYMARKVPTDPKILSPDERDAFMGFVIPEEADKEPEDAEPELRAATAEV